MTTLSTMTDEAPLAVRPAPGGGALDPTATVVAFAALRLTAADPRAVPNRGVAAALLGRFGRLLEIVAQPGRGAAAVDLAPRADGNGLAAHLLVGIAARDEPMATLEARAAAEAVSVVLMTVPHVWAVTFADPQPLLSLPPTPGVRIVQRTITVDDGDDEASAVPRFERPADVDDAIVRLLVDNEARLRVSVLSTSLGIDDHQALQASAEAAKRIAERAGDSPLGLRARRIAATIADNCESLHTPVFCVDATVSAERTLPETTARAIAGQLTTELDVIHRGERADLASPTVAGRTRLVGGYELRPLSPAQVERHLTGGLPVPGGHGPRGLEDLVSLTEAAALCRWPLPAAGPLPGLPAHTASRTLPAPAVAHGVTVGTDGAGGVVRIRLGDPAGHLHIVGDTGSGKTTAMAAMIDQLAAAGVKVVIIDPHRSLATQAVASLRRHRRRTAVLNAADPSTLALNVLPRAQSASAGDLDGGVARIVDAIVSMWNAEWSGPRFRDIGDAALRALAHIGGAHPFGHVSQLLTVEAVGRLPDAGVPVDVVHSLHRTVTSKEASDLIGWFVWKFSILGRSAAVRRLTAAVGEGVLAEDLLDDHDGVVISIGDDAVSRDQSALLGHLVVSLLIDAMLARADNDRHPVVFFIDEAHRYTCQALQRALVEGRKFGLSVVAAHQHLTQLPRDLNDALAGNAATLVALRAGADAVPLGQRLSIDADELRGLPDLAGFVRLHDDSGRRVTASLRLAPPTTVPPLTAGERPDEPLPSLLDLIRRPDPVASSFLDEWLAKRMQTRAAEGDGG